MKKNFIKPQVLLIFLVSLVSVIPLSGQDDLNVITGKWLKYGNSQNSLYEHLAGILYRQLSDRDDKLSRISTIAEWQERQRYIHDKLLECTGPFPAKTPLNARVTRVINKDGFRVEHIIFESIPGFYVTSSMYIPSALKNKDKAPAVIYCSGHSADGYRSDVYQHVILNLVKKGFIVFAFDPVGQGERLEYFDAQKGKSYIGGPTSEHSYPGAQAFLTGNQQAMYMIWDGIRSVDYLVTRREVDSTRIGITGRSGGGTQSAYIAAYDSRIYAAAPENYITNYRRLLETIGPQDAEQNLFYFIQKGLDHPDFLIVRAPKPALMITTSNDMFSIQGVKETEKQVSLVYKALGKPDNFSRCEDDAPHASTKKNREAMYAFFQEHLRNPGNRYDEEVILLTKEEMKVTETGQLSTSLGGETVFSLNMKRALQLETILRTKESSPEKIISAAKRLSGYIDPIPDEAVFTGRIIRNGYRIEKYYVRGEGEYIIPYLLFIPPVTDKSMIYLHPRGKAAEGSEGGEIEAFVKRGYTVLAPDLPGIGENGPGALKGDAYFGGASHNLWYAAMLGGRSITGIQAGDVSKLAGLLSKISTADITGFARQGMCPVMLHAALFSGKIGNLVLARPYSSFLSIVTDRNYDPMMFMSTVPAALTEYDLPLLEAAFAPRKLVIAGVTDSRGDTTAGDRIEKDLSIVREAYRKPGAENRLVIMPGAGKGFNFF